jgi:hypothetical protein
MLSAVGSMTNGTRPVIRTVSGRPPVLGRVVGHEGDLADAELAQDLGADAVLAAVDGQTLDEVASTVSRPASCSV